VRKIRDKSYDKLSLDVLLHRYDDSAFAPKYVFASSEVEQPISIAFLLHLNQYTRINLSFNIEVDVRTKIDLLARRIHEKK